MFITSKPIIKCVTDLVSDKEDDVIVADLGCGAGDLIIDLATNLSPEARLYAVDVQKSLLERVKNKARDQGHENVMTVWSDLEGDGHTAIAEGSLDAAMLVNVMFQIQDKMAMAREASRLVKKSGALIISDWRDSFGGLGPQNDDLFVLEDAVAWCEDNGFFVNKVEHPTDYHYILIATKE